MRSSTPTAAPPSTVKTDPTTRPCSPRVDNSATLPARCARVMGRTAHLRRAPVLCRTSTPGGGELLEEPRGLLALEPIGVEGARGLELRPRLGEVGEPEVHEPEVEPDDRLVGRLGREGA